MSDIAVGRSGMWRHVAYVLRSNPVTAVALRISGGMLLLQCLGPRDG